MKVVTLTDLHFNQRLKRKTTEKLISRVSEARPELILVLGDLIDYVNELENKEVEERILEFFGKLGKIAPVLAVYGNHDMTFKTKGEQVEKIPMEFREKLEKIQGVKILDNQLVKVRGRIFVGFNPSGEYYQIGEKKTEDEEVLRREIRKLVSSLNLKTDKPKYFLTHSPLRGDVLKEELRDFNLIFTGHMHNGCLPQILLGLTKNKGIIGPSKGLFPKYAHGKSGNLVILPPVSTFPSHLRFLQPFYPRYISIFEL